MNLKNLKVTVRLDRIDKDGRVHVGEEQETHSWTAQIFKQFFCYITFQAINTVKDTGGVNRTLNYSTYSNCTATAGQVTRGIIVGIGNTPTTIDDYKLETVITDGSGAGQLEYEATVSATVCTNSPAGTWYFDHKRTFTNGSGDTITINEVGLYGYWSTIYYHMLERTVLGVPYSVLNGEGCIVTYRISLTV